MYSATAFREQIHRRQRRNQLVTLPSPNHHGSRSLVRSSPDSCSMPSCLPTSCYSSFLSLDQESLWCGISDPDGLFYLPVKKFLPRPNNDKLEFIFRIGSLDPPWQLSVSSFLHSCYVVTEALPYPRHGAAAGLPKVNFFEHQMTEKLSHPAGWLTIFGDQSFQSWRWLPVSHRGILVETCSLAFGNVQRILDPSEQED